MRKIIVFIGILALVIGTAGVAKVYADTYGTGITIYDQAPYVANQLLPANENAETEPGTLSGQGWDLEAFQQNINILTIIGGFNFATGNVHESGQSAYHEPIGALFLKTGGAPPYGASPGQTGGTGQVANSNWGYDYAITFAFTFDNDGNCTGGTYTVWTPGSDPTIDQCHNSDGGSAGNVSNPYTIVKSTWSSGPTGTFTYDKVLSDFDSLTGGYHYVISGIDLSFLITNPALGNPETWLHLTYACGNDNLMGYVAANTVPIPPSALLLGSGLLGLVGLGWRRRKS